MSDKFTMPSPDSLACKLRDARKATGLSTREVVARIGDRYKISHATIANFEKGLSVPGFDLLPVLAWVYDRSPNWFLSRNRSLSGFQYRRLKSGVKVADLQRYEGQAQRWLEAYVKLEEYTGEPLVRKIHQPNEHFAVDGDGRAAAVLVRRHYDLKDDQPVHSVTELLSDFGIRTIELPTDLDVEGFAARFDREHAVILNPSIANDRSRMNAGHELGHVLFDDCDGDSTASSKLIEARAFEFASHLLIPEVELEKAFKVQSMVKLVHTKERYGISLAAMITRASRAGYISESQTKWLWVEFSKRGWRKLEPGLVRPDRATRFEDLLAIALGDQRLTWRSAAELLDVREEELQRRMIIALGGKTNEGCEDPSTIPIR